LESFFLILLYLTIGALCKRIKRFGPETPAVLNTFVLYIALPALILQKIPSLQFSADLLIPALVPWLLLLIVVMLILAISRYLKWSKEVTVALLIVLPLGNTSFLGFPMISAFFGDSYLPYALIYDQVGSFVALATYSTMLAAVYSPNHTSTDVGWSARAMLMKIITFPPFIALVVALLMRGLPYPSLLQSLIDQLAATLVPLIMIAVGYSFQWGFSGERFSPIAVGLTIKLMLMPFLVWAGCYSLGLSGKAVDVTIFEAAMPPMISAGAIAITAGLAPRMVTALVGFGLMASFVTLPFWYWVLR
jgi:hypothetical protein